jgi:plastocyanin
MADSSVHIRDLAFSPVTVQVTQGESVEWVNDEDAMPHNVGSGMAGRPDMGELFLSPYLMSGDRFSFTFNDVGEFPYICPLHPSMSGVIIVSPS